jgi:hypothetical protein
MNRLRALVQASAVALAVFGTAAVLGWAYRVFLWAAGLG